MELYIFMKNVDYSKYDKDSADQLRFIHLKEAIEDLEKAIAERPLNVGCYLESRVKVLEESRQRQIALNSTFAQKGITEAQKVSKPKGLWDWLK